MHIHKTELAVDQKVDTIVREAAMTTIKRLGLYLGYDDVFKLLEVRYLLTARGDAGRP